MDDLEDLVARYEEAAVRLGICRAFAYIQRLRAAGREAELAAVVGPGGLREAEEAFRSACDRVGELRAQVRAALEIDEVN